MRMTVSALSLSVLCLGAATAGAAGIRGDYVEARTADVFTGPCFSNAEVFISGNRAVMAWKVTEGSWNGVDLRGLCVAAAVDGTTTFSEDQPEKADSVLIVDAQGRRAAARGADRAGQDFGRWPAQPNRQGDEHAHEPEARRPCPNGGSEAGTRQARHAAVASGVVLGGRTRQDRDASPRRTRPRLRQRGDRLSSAVQRRQRPARIHARSHFQGPGSPGQLGRPELPEQLRRSFRPLTGRFIFRVTDVHSQRGNVSSGIAGQDSSARRRQPADLLRKTFRLKPDLLRKRRLKSDLLRIEVRLQL